MWGSRFDQSKQAFMEGLAAAGDASAVAQLAEQPVIEDPVTYSAYVHLANARRFSMAVGPGGAVPIPDPIQASEIAAYLGLHGITDSATRARMTEAIMACDLAERTKDGAP